MYAILVSRSTGKNITTSTTLANSRPGAENLESVGFWQVGVCSHGVTLGLSHKKRLVTLISTYVSCNSQTESADTAGRQHMLSFAHLQLKIGYF